MADQVKRIVLRCKIHFKGFQLHPIQLCAIVLKKVPNLGQLKRGLIRANGTVMEHFWIEGDGGAIYDPAPLYFNVPWNPEYNVDRGEGEVQRIPANEQLWEKRENPFQDWDKKAKGCLSKVLRAN